MLRTHSFLSVLFIGTIILSGCSKKKCSDPEPTTPSSTTPTSSIPTPTPPVKVSVKNIDQTSFPSLLAVQFQDTSRGYISGVSGFLQKTTDGGATWSNIAPGTSGDLYGLYFLSNSEGYAGANNGDLFKTTNGGTNWNKLTTPDNSFGYGSFYFVNSSIGFIAGGTASTVGSLLKTTDGGATWTSISIPGLSSVYDMYFINNTTGFICGYKNQVFRTSDGGNTWVDKSPTPNVSGISSILLDEIQFSNSGEGYCIGYSVAHEKNYIFKSTNNGDSWTQLTSPPQTYSTADVYTSMFTVSPTELYIAGGNTEHDSQTFIHSSDGGASWTNVPNSATHRLFKSCYIDNKFYVVGLSGTILKSN